DEAVRGPHHGDDRVLQDARVRGVAGAPADPLAADGELVGGGIGVLQERRLARALVARVGHVVLAVHADAAVLRDGVRAMRLAADARLGEGGRAERGGERGGGGEGDAGGLADHVTAPGFWCCADRWSFGSLECRSQTPKGWSGPPRPLRCETSWPPPAIPTRCLASAGPGATPRSAVPTGSSSSSTTRITTTGPRSPSSASRRCRT